MFCFDVEFFAGFGSSLAEESNPLCPIWCILVVLFR